jgi:hypothetical protein
VTNYLIQALYITDDERHIKAIAKELIPPGPRHWQFMKPAEAGPRPLILYANPYHAESMAELIHEPLETSDIVNLVAQLLSAEPTPKKITIDAAETVE